MKRLAREWAAAFYPTLVYDTHDVNVRHDEAQKRLLTTILAWNEESVINAFSRGIVFALLLHDKHLTDHDRGEGQAEYDPTE